MTSSFNPWPHRLRHLKKAMTSFVGNPLPSLRIQHLLTEILRASNFCDRWGAQEKDRGAAASSQRADASHPDNALWNYFAAHKEGRGIIKFKHYLDIYHRHLSRFVGRNVHVVEIGVQSGGSLEMWTHYFGPGCHVTGIDIQQGCKCFEDAATTILIGDQADRSFWKKFREQSPPVDILIEDGGHEPEQQMVTLEEMLPYVRPGGVYICEDIWATEFMAYMYALTQKLNDVAVNHKAPERDGAATGFQASINSIHFYPCAVVIEKNETPLDRFQILKQGTDWKTHLA